MCVMKVGLEKIELSWLSYEEYSFTCVYVCWHFSLVCFF